MQYKYSGKTDIGLEREVNQDNLGMVNLDWGSIFIVSDGFGHKEGGEFASEYTVDTFLQEFSKKEPKNIEQFLNNTFTIANDHIYYEKVSKYENAMMGCTAVVLITMEGLVYIAHIGDSRAYLIRNGKLKQLTNDHSYVQNLIDRGELTLEKAMFHPKRHVLRRALGSPRGANPDYSMHSILPNDKFILCSDGVWGFISKESLIKEVDRDDIRDSTAAVIERVKCNMGSDNITLQVINF